MDAPYVLHRLTPNDIVTEDSAAQQFVELHGDMLRYCHSRGKWLRWNGFYWEIDNTSLAFHWVRELDRQLAEDQDDRKRYKISATSFAGGVERFAKCDSSVAVTMEFWDRDKWLLGTPGGTVDLRSGLLRPGSCEDAVTKVTAVTPNSSGCPRWLRFLVETTGDAVIA